VGQGEQFYFNQSTLEELARAQFASARTVHLVVDGALDEQEIRLLSGYLTGDGRLSSLPLQGKKFKTALKYASAVFSPGEVYTEKEINQALERIHNDTAMLRRGLVDAGILLRERDGSRYWLAETAS
jgi:hypothetical protein